MSIQQSLCMESVQIGSNARNKEEVLAEVASLAARNPILQKVSEKRILQALQKRETLGSTGFNNGIAIPHCSLPDVEDFVVGVLSLPEGIDFHSIDGSKTRLIFFIVGPENNRNRHIRILSSLSKTTRTPGLLKTLTEATDPAALRDSLLVNMGSMEETPVDTARCQFTLFIQEEEIFEDILEILSSKVDGSIAVMETSNASYYLNKLPLFSAFWTENHHSFSRVIIAVVDKSIMNDTIRRIHMVTEVEKNPGVLITVQDLIYSSGSIEF